MKEKYLSSRRFQFYIGIPAIILCTAIILFWFRAATLNPLVYFLLPVVTSCTQFLSTPFFRATGTFKYYSPFLIVYNPNKKRYDLHSGTSFDYLLHMKRSEGGIPGQKKILKYFIEGLLNIISEIEAGKLSKELIIEGTSYFFSERTAKKLGFSMAKATLFYRFNLFVNAIDIFWMYSYAHNRLAFPKIWKAKKMEVKAGDLLADKPYLQKLYDKL